MAFIIDNQSEISLELGKMSTFKKKFKEFSNKIHLANFTYGLKCNIEHIDSIANLYVKTNNDPRISVGIIVLDRGLEFWFHFGFRILSVGIRNDDVIGWQITKIDSNWFLFLYTHTNIEENKETILFIVKNQNLPVVRDFFTKYGFKELL